MDINALVKAAIDGNKTALEGITAAIQDNIYHLSLRMLANPDDAKDATQDILIKVITKLSSFRFDSQFNTWVYRIATNYLISEKKILQRDTGLSFDIYKMDLEQDLQDPTELTDNPDYQAMLNQLRISCTMAMLLCLNASHRIAYILGDIMEMDHGEASQVLEISKDNFRKQLSRARTKVVQFTHSSCGLVNSCANCSCEKKLTSAIQRQRVNPNRLHLSENSDSNYIEIKDALQETKEQLKTITLQQSIGHYKCPIELGMIIESLVDDSTRFHIRN